MIKPIFSVLAQAEKQFFSKLVFECLFGEESAYRRSSAKEAIVEGIESRETLEIKKEYLCVLENFLADKRPPLAEVAKVTEGKAKDSGVTVTMMLVRVLRFPQPVQRNFHPYQEQPKRMRHPLPMFIYSCVVNLTFVRTISIGQGTVVLYQSMLSPTVCVVLPVMTYYCPKFLSKTTPTGQRILLKNKKIPTQGQGSYVKCSYPEAMIFILGIHQNQTRQKYCTSLSLRKTEIILPINSTKSNSHKY